VHSAIAGSGYLLHGRSLEDEIFPLEVGESLRTVGIPPHFVDSHAFLCFGHELSEPSLEFGATLFHFSRNSASNPAVVVFIMKNLLWTSLFLLVINSALADVKYASGMASWYGEEHRGRLMANGKRFNPDRLTAASWFYPLGTKVRVTLKSDNQNPRSVLVTITDRGPAKELVLDGRIIDLTHAAFKRLGHPAIGLVAVTVEPLN